MNDDTLFNYGEELLKELSIDIKKCKKDNWFSHTKDIIYTLPVKNNIEDYFGLSAKEIKKIENNNYFIFNGKVYDSDKIYRINYASTNKLLEVAPISIYEPEILPQEIKQLSSNATNKKRKSVDCDRGCGDYNLIHNEKNNYYYNKIIDRNINIENDNDIFNFNYGGNLKVTMIKERAEPIYVKINCKENFTVTHLGFLGSKIPIFSCSSAKIKKIIKNGKKVLSKSILLYNSSIPYSFVKKIEIWYKGNVTKNWNHLKNVVLKWNGFNACFEEDIVPIFNNINGTDGIRTIELKIIPTEYVNAPSLRIAVYGKINNGNNGNNGRNGKNGKNNISTVDCVVTKPYVNGHIFKFGGNYNDCILEKNPASHKKREIMKKLRDDVFSFHLNGE